MFEVRCAYGFQALRKVVSIYRFHISFHKFRIVYGYFTKFIKYSPHGGRFHGLTTGLTIYAYKGRGKRLLSP